MSTSQLGTYVAFTDGSFTDSYGGIYGSGAIIAPINTTNWTVLKSAGNKQEYLSHRNVAGEIFAATSLFNYILQDLPQCKNLILVYDYEGIGNWLTKTWKAKKPITQLYVGYYEQYVKPAINVTFQHTYGHSGNTGNEIVDKLAKEAIQDFIHEKFELGE